MVNSIRWQSSTASILALAITAGTLVPLFKPEAAIAQFRIPRRPHTTTLPTQRFAVAVPAGTTVQVQFDDAEKILLTPDESQALTLKVARAITARGGSVLIPAGSELVGRLEPARGGSQFVASELVVRPGERREQRYQISARSRIVTRTERVKRGADTGDILESAAIGGAAAAALSALLGDRAIATEEILGGLGLGALGGLLLNRREVDVVVIYPDRDLAVRLDSALALR